MSFSFSIRVVDSDGDPRESVRVTVADSRSIGLGSYSERTDEDGVANFDWPDGSSADIDVYVDGDKEGDYVIEDDETVTVTVDP